MHCADTGPVTEWLARWHAGEEAAIEHLVPLVYDELRRAARSQLRRELRDHTLSPTALVHETYLRLLGQRRLSATDRKSLLAVAGHTMRRILVDYARARTRLKRGGAVRPVSLEASDDPALLTQSEAEEVLAMDVALTRLARLDERAWRVVECRVFAGLTLEETAQALAISSKSVQRTWTAARAWLRKEMQPTPAVG
jgi:RNA polymerase sigma factor (TIGR02999 family)